MKVRAIIFDVDNTLIDFIKFKELAIDEAIYAMIAAGLKKDKDDIWKAIDEVYLEKGVEYQKVFDDVLMKLTGEIDYKILAAAIVAYRKVKAGHMDPYANVIPTLIELIKRGYKLGVISDAPKLQMWTRLCDLNLQDFFEFVVSAEDVGERKPSPLPFEHALNLLRLKPHEVAMIGDDYDRDVEGAKKMGMTAILAKYGRQKRKIAGIDIKESESEAKPDHVIGDISELLDIF